MRLLFITLVLSAACFQSLAQTAGRLRAGAYAADITPVQWPVRIIGGFTEPLASHARDPLHARAIVLDNGSQVVAIVVVDSCYVPRDLFDRAKYCPSGDRLLGYSSLLFCLGFVTKL